MRILISWSGEKSRKVGQELRKWLPLIFETVEIWVSSKNIGAGERWSTALAEELEKADFGIICLTKENQDFPWILFEAGALAKSVESGRVIPYLIDLEPEDISGPLSSFQAIKSGKSGTKKLVESISSSSLENKRSPENLKKLFEILWPKLKTKISVIKDKYE